MNFRALTLAISCITVACTPHDREESMVNGAQAEDVVGGDKFLLSPQQLHDLQLTASRDDGESAFEIYLHLMVGGSREGIGEENPNYWLDMSADKGFLPAIQHRVSINLEVGSRQSCLDAISDIEGLDAAGRAYLSEAVPESSLARCRG